MVDQVLVQCQGIVVGFLASLVGMAIDWIPDPNKVMMMMMMIMIITSTTSALAPKEVPL